jgi:hypothetical protein
MINMATEDTSFQELTVKELKALAEMFAVDLDGFTKKADIIKEIEENGVTFEMYKGTLEEEDVDDATEVVIDESLELPVDEPEVDESDAVLVKMIRPNHSYEIRGYKFTRQHPFVPVSKDDADYLVEKDGGFRAASPRELREFYGA